MKEYSSLLSSPSSLNCPKNTIAGSALSPSSTRRRRHNNPSVHLLSSPLIMLLWLLPLSSFTCLFVSAGRDMEQFESFQGMFENSNRKAKPALPNFDDNLGLSSSSSALRTPPKQSVLAEESSPVPNLFKEYLTRGMYTCTSRYVHTIGKLHALIKDAYEEYASCQKLMKDTTKSFTPTQFELLDELLEEWQDEQDGSTTTSPLENNTQASTPSSHMTNVDILPASAAPNTPEENKPEDNTQTTRVRRSQRLLRHLSQGI